MNKINSRIASKALLLLGLALACHAQAGTTWQFSGVDGGNATTSYASGALLVSGYAATNGNTTLTSNGTSTTSDDGPTSAVLNSGFANNAAWGAQTVSYWNGGGLAMNSDGNTTPNHAIDNAGGNTEAVLLSFTSSQILTSIGLGYKNTDADISLWRYTGSSTPTVTNKGASYASMVAAGWELVGNYGDLSQDTSSPYNLVNNALSPSGDPNTNANAGTNSVGSSWWLITAYNSSYGGATSGTVDQGNDFFKIYGVTTTACSTSTGNICSGSRTNVPEPGSLALAGLALGGVFFTRRRKVVATI